MADPDFVPTPEMIAAAWDQWMPRHKPHVRIGPGPAFREAIAAAIRVMPKPETPSPVENEER